MNQQTTLSISERLRHPSLGMRDYLGVLVRPVHYLIFQRAENHSNLSFAADLFARVLADIQFKFWHCPHDANITLVITNDLRWKVLMDSKAYLIHTHNSRGKRNPPSVSEIFRTAWCSCILRVLPITVGTNISRLNGMLYILKPRVV